MTYPTLLVISNCPPQDAERLARALIEGRYAACVTLSAVKSVYRWEGALCVDEEVTLTAKVSQERAASCVAQLTALHPYELPEVLCVPVDPALSSEAYCAWVEAECSEP